MGNDRTDTTLRAQRKTLTPAETTAGPQWIRVPVHQHNAASGSLTPL